MMEPIVFICVVSPSSNYHSLEGPHLALHKLFFLTCLEWFSLCNDFCFRIDCLWYSSRSWKPLNKTGREDLMNLCYIVGRFPQAKLPRGWRSTNSIGIRQTWTFSCLDSWLVRTLLLLLVYLVLLKSLLILTMPCALDSSVLLLILKLILRSFYVTVELYQGTLSRDWLFAS